MKEAKVSYLIFMDAEDTIDEGSYKKILSEFKKDEELDVGSKKSEDSRITPRYIADKSIVSSEPEILGSEYITRTVWSRMLRIRSEKMLPMFREVR